MELEVIGKGVELTEAMKKQAASKIGRIESLFPANENLKGVVVYKVHPTDQSCEVSVSSPTITLRAKTVGQDTYECLNLSIDKLEGQMRKVKTRVERNRNKALITSLGLQLDSVTNDKEVAPENIVRYKKLDLVPMDVQEAIARMDALNHHFFIYLDSQSGQVNILYVRQEGGFGVIEVDNK